MRSIYALLLALSAPCPARGAPASDRPTHPALSDAQAVTAPKLVYDPGVSYPNEALRSGFHERVEVVLVLEIDVRGEVSRATLVTPGRSEFDDAALAASGQLRFAPATRQGRPVAAKIRFQYVFEPPTPVLSGRVLAADSGRPVGSARIHVSYSDGRTETLASQQDGSFRSETAQTGTARVRIDAQGFSSQDTTVSLVPGSEVRVEATLALAVTETTTNRDAAPPPLEVVVRGERLAPAVSSLTRAEVRQMPGAFGDPFRAIEALPGVTPIGSGLPFFYVRGAPPGNVGYFLDGVRIPFLYHVAIGPSVIHPGLVDRVDLYPGGYPARFGRYAGGIVSAETTAPRFDTRGEANIRLFDAGALVETGFAGGRGSVLIGGRYSYTAAIFSLLVPDLVLDYRDYQLRVSYDVSSDHRVTLFGLGSYDLLAQKQPGGLNVLFGSEFYRADLRHDYRYHAGTVRSAVTLGYDQTHFSDEGNARDHSVALRSEVTHALGATATLRAGADVLLDRYSSSTPRYVDPESPEVVAFARNNPARTDRTGGVRADIVVNVAPNIELVPGVRLDLYTSQSNTEVAVDPRLAARFELNENVAIVHAYGIAHQPPAFVLPLPGRAPAGLAGGLQKSLQASAGVELDLGDGTKLTSTLFHNVFLNMADALSSSHEGPPDARPVERSLGSALGFELFLHRKLSKRLGGFVSYTLSRSMRSVGRESFPSSFDRTHVLNAAVAYDLGRNWRAGTRVVFYTGNPKFEASDGTIPELRSGSPSRVAPFYRVDLRLEKRWNLGESTWIAFVTEVLNSTLSKETFGDQAVGPITIPSIGAELGF